jgi:2'-5' RNA ligase
MAKEELETRRLFIGIEPDAEYISKLGKVAKEGAEDAHDDWGPTEPSDLHLTLLYLGDVAEVAIPSLKEVIASVAKSSQSFGLRGGRVMVMRPDEPYMIWLRFEDDRWYTQLVGTLERACARIGTWRPEGSRRNKFENKTPVPHITLARMRDGRLADSLLPPFGVPTPLSKIHVTRISLYESIREKGQDGLHYKILDSWPLGEGDDEEDD